jgi:hypothetical protein
VHHDSRSLIVRKEDVSNYSVRIVVAGSRTYLDYPEFLYWLREYLKFKNFNLDDVVMISGMAPNGPDEMIVRRCEEIGFRYAPFPADWDGLGKAAGFIRNEEMARAATHSLIYWEGQSSGTENMIKLSYQYELDPTVIMVYPTVNPQSFRKNHHGWQQNKSASNYPGRD